MRLFVRVSFFKGTRIEFENCRAYNLAEVDKLVVIDQRHQYVYVVQNDDESIADMASKLINGLSTDQSTRLQDFIVACIDTQNILKDSLQLYYYAGDVNARLNTVFRDGDYIKLIFCVDPYKEQHRSQISQESLMNQAKGNLDSQQFDQQSNFSDNGEDQSPEEVPITMSQSDPSRPPSKKVAKKWQTLAANNILTNIVIRGVGGYVDFSRQQLNVPFDGDAFSVMDLVLLDQDIQSEINEDDRTITRSYSWNKVLASTEAEYYQKDSAQDDYHVDDDDFKVRNVKSSVLVQNGKRRAETDGDYDDAPNSSSATQSTDMLNDVIDDYDIDIDMLISLDDFSNVEVGFLLAFKTLEMNQHTCCPYWTDWRYGRVVKVNSQISVDVKLQYVRQSTSQQVSKRQSRKRKSKSSLLLAGNSPNDELVCSAADQILSLEVNQTTTIRCLPSTLKKEAIG
ncbi:hypothetical protein MP228_004441 [Amoeboaphelidium protococcarum]|nr:hypothetical protein MP228_004441 [Amoeboaphelidium protococcarum]